MAFGVAPFVAKRNTPLDGIPFAGIKNVERRFKYVQKGLRPTRGRAELRSTSARWAWAEYMLAQGGPEMGLAVLEAVHNGGSFGDWKRALKKVEPSTMRPWAETESPLIERSIPIERSLCTIVGDHSLEHMVGH